MHCEEVSGCGKPLGETNGHRTFKFSSQAVSLNAMDCSSLDDVTRLCATWLSKLEQRKQEILELGAQLASLSRQVENSFQYRYDQPFCLCMRYRFWPNILCTHPSNVVPLASDLHARLIRALHLRRRCCVPDARWSDHPHNTHPARVPPREHESYSFMYCDTDRNVRTLAAITTKLNAIACGRETRFPILWIFKHCGGDLKCAQGVVTMEELARAFRHVAPLVRSEADRAHSPRRDTVDSLARNSTGDRAPPLKLHTMITRGFDRVASSDISQLKLIKVMLVGMVNAGKSSFLNVLLGLDKDIHFPTNESSWTRMITKLKYGPAKTWCLRTTDEREQRVTEQCQFDSSDAENSSRILNALCAYGRSKYDARPRWLDQLARHEIDQVLNTLATADEEAARVVQQKYAVSDADIDVTRQWLARVSTQGSTALAQVSLLEDFKNKFLSERRTCIGATCRAYS